MFAVGIEGGVTQAKTVVDFAAADRLFLSFVTDHQFASLVGRGKHDHQARHHPIDLFPIAVRQKEAARFVEQQVIQMAGQLLLGQTQVLLHSLHRLGQELVPLGIGQTELVRHELPGFADFGIDKGFRALAVGRRFTEFLELFRLLRRKRKTDRSERIDLQTGQHKGRRCR